MLESIKAVSARMWWFHTTAMTGAGQGFLEAEYLHIAQ